MRSVHHRVVRRIWVYSSDTRRTSSTGLRRAKSTPDHSQPSSLPPPASRSESEAVAAGTDDELEGRRLVAYRGYLDALERFPDSVELHKAAGRLAVQLARADEAVSHLTKAALRMTTDAEVEYYLGEAYVLSHDDERARGWIRTRAAPVGVPDSGAPRARPPRCTGR